MGVTYEWCVGVKRWVVKDRMNEVDFYWLVL